MLSVTKAQKLHQAGSRSSENEHSPLSMLWYESECLLCEQNPPIGAVLQTAGPRSEECTNIYPGVASRLLFQSRAETFYELFLDYQKVLLQLWIIPR